MRLAAPLALGFLACRPDQGVPVVGSPGAAQSSVPRTSVPAAVGSDSGRTHASSATASAYPSTSPAPLGPCPDDMVLAGSFCVDRYEAPNKKGEKPLRMQSSQDGDKFCRERGKHLCTEDEWLRACGGKGGRPFPYGNKYRPGACNDTGEFRSPSWRLLGQWPHPAAAAESERLDQSEPSGARPECVSDEGVFDLTGNVGEWVRRTRENETNYSHVVKGCFWGKCFRPPHQPSCEYVNFAHPAGFRSYELGFRCCAPRQPRAE